MSDTRELVWEVGCEELPAWACNQIAQQLPRLVEAALAEARLAPADASAPEVLVGPRRFAVRTSVLPATAQESGVTQGPPLAIAFKDGAWTKAGEGFARKMGVPADELVQEDGFVKARFERPSQPFAHVWPAVAEGLLSGLNFAKPMRWGSSPHRFVRPLRWVTTLLGEEPMEYEVWGLPSSATTRTHRFLGAEREAVVPSAAAYTATLESHHVIVDQHERRARIERELDTAAAAFGGEWYDPAGVLDEVVHLVEFPTVITGHFDEQYLDLPDRVLVTSMQSHQRYFPVRSGQQLAPAFLAVMNADPAALGTILPGYELVLQGRLDDAVFSFGRDRERGLDDMATEHSLGAVVFHARAGSLAQRRDRITAVAREIAHLLGVDEAQACTAARLAKADQVSYVVQEFAELEGFAGSLYARAAGHPEPVAVAIDQQFLPRGENSPLPAPGVPAVLALADKFELLATMFSIGEQPTGSRDPHALRRAAIGIMRIIVELDLPLDISPVTERAFDVLEQQGFARGDRMELHRFLADRVEKRLTDGGVRIDAVRAARAAQLPRLQHLEDLARALDGAVRAGDERFLAVATATKRCANIVAKAGATRGEIDPAHFAADTERALHEQLESARGAVRTAVEERRFDNAVAAAAALGPAVDAFFDRETGVMVMAEDEQLRRNRLALVSSVLECVAPLGDMSELQIG